MLALKSAVKFRSETKLLALITTLRTTKIIMQLNQAYRPLDVGYTKNDPSKVMTFAAMVNIGGNAS